MTNFDEKMKYYVQMTEKHLENSFPEINDFHRDISKAARYSLLAGGKRIRPVMCLAVSDMLGTPLENVIDFACSLEMVHTFSLIHDDLPGMDNDDFRRGRPTCHKVFGEAIAILAGDALLNKAYENMIKRCIDYPLEGNIKAMSVLAAASGADGMIGGQVIDIQSENKKISIDLLKKLHLMKTGALLKAPVMISLALSKAENSTRKSLEKFAENIGLAFQIRDDILDVVSTTEEMGKTVGKDADSSKSTYVTILGLEGAKTELKKTIDYAADELKRISDQGYDVDFLEKMTYYLLERKN